MPLSNTLKVFAIISEKRQNVPVARGVRVTVDIQKSTLQRQRLLDNRVTPLFCPRADGKR